MIAGLGLPDVMRWFDDIEPVEARDWASAGIEILLLTWLFYVVLRFLHGTKGLAVFKGAVITIIALITAVNVMALVFQLEFPRLEAAWGVILPAATAVLVILFQPELRTGLTRLSERGPLTRGEAPGQLADFATSIRKLSRQHVGALVVFERDTGLRNLQATGVPLDADLSGALVESIFYPKSPLHDGAVIVRAGRIVAASVTLPLTESTSLARNLGTRHRAALGVTEETDAVAVVVSEETGQVSVAHRGFLHPIDNANDLMVNLKQLLQGEREVAPA
ncbi:MAG: DNA integrity scanning protein DisA nucleotide-binding domain protein [Planctomycetes bacterium]|nr:DNA integrity scanning protein DisA nucleotide-binding domain protein [Planctomycetota bacterium]